MDKTLFKEYLLQLTKLLCFDADWNMTKFVRAQQIRNGIYSGRANNKLTWDEYKVLYYMVEYLIDEMRDVLRKAGKLHD